MLTGVHTQLRAVERADLPQLLRWRNTPALRQFFRERRELAISDQLAWFERISSPAADARMFAVEQRSSGGLIGCCGLCYIDWVDRSTEISMYIGADMAYVDQTLAPDAARVLIDHAFDTLDLRRVWVEVYAFDTLKAELFERLGFSLEGRLREQRFHAGTHHDSLLFGLLRSER